MHKQAAPGAALVPIQACRCSCLCFIAGVLFSKVPLFTESFHNVLLVFQRKAHSWCDLVRVCSVLSSDIITVSLIKTHLSSRRDV